MTRVKAALAAAVGRARDSGALGPVARVGVLVLAIGAFAAIGSVAARGDTRAAAAAASASSPAPEPLPLATVSASAEAARDPPPPPAGGMRGRATPDDPVYLNTATVEDLQRLPGVGPKKASAILAFRKRVGRFRQVDELMRVRGIGRGAMKKLRPVVRLDPPSEGMDVGAGRT